MERDDRGAMFSDADIQRVADDIETVRQMFSSPMQINVGECSSIFGPSLVISASLPGVASARMTLSVRSWERISSNPSPVARGCMWACSLMDQILTQAHVEWNIGGPAQDDDDEDEDD